MDNFVDKYQIDNQSLEVINGLTNRYVSSLFSESTERGFAQNADELQLEDIDANLSILKTQISLKNSIRRQSGYPCLIVDKHPVPINISQYLEDHEKRQSLNLDGYSLYGDRFWEERFYFFLRSLENQKEKDVAFLNEGDLRENLRSALSSFIAIRHASRFNDFVKSDMNNFLKGGSPPNSSSSSSPGYLTVDLTTKHHGLQVQASPAYFVSWSYFGSPSSPVSGSLKPGRYIFGGSGVGLPTFTPDKTVVDIPPNFKITLSGI